MAASPPPDHRRIAAGFLRSAGTLSGATIAAQAIWAASAPAITRLYGAEAFGVWALVAVAVHLAGSFGVARYEFALVLARGAHARANLFAACLGLAVLAALLLLAANLALAETLIAAFERQVGRAGALACGPLCAVALFQQVLRTWALAFDRTGAIARFMVAQALLIAALQIGLALAGHASADALLFGHLGGALAAFGLLVHALRDTLHWRLLRRLRRAAMAAELRRHANLPLYSAPRTVVDAVAGRAIYFVFAHAFGLHAAGQLGLAARLVQVPVSLIVGGLRNAFFLRAVQLQHSPALPRMVVGLECAIAYAVMPASVVLAAHGPSLFALAFGAPWAEAGGYAAALIAGTAMLTITGWLDRLYEVFGRQRLALLLELANLVLILALQLALAALGHGPMAVAIAVGAWTAFYNIAWLGITAELARIGAIFPAIMGRVALAAAAAALPIGAARLLALPGPAQGAIAAGAIMSGLALALWRARREIAGLMRPDAAPAPAPAPTATRETIRA
ncbi:MAG: hypothetical protein IT557_15280 [Alphaproteobacteria bacterium]|nr:hypothetical protein [Alphaproteobacteria bacterium]